MCGICGVVQFGAPADTATVQAMTNALAHRGPDGDGFFFADEVAFGHRRLSVIDLSHAGDQPFASEDGTLQLIHNGEIYNYRELRAELAGADPALIQDALYDAEEYLRAEIASHPDKSEADVLELIASTYGEIGRAHV